MAAVAPATVVDDLVGGEGVVGVFQLHQQEMEADRQTVEEARAATQAGPVALLQD